MRNKHSGFDPDIFFGETQLKQADVDCCFTEKKMEARVGIEPAYTELQSAA